ncbi:MAG: transglutaminase domain-containing protein [Planctomycetota bacterium]
MNSFSRLSGFIVRFQALLSRVLLIVILFPGASIARDSDIQWMTDKMVAALENAGANGVEIRDALEDVTDADQQAALVFLIENLQEVELRRTDAASLVADVALACRARDEMVWGNEIPDELFFNDVLPWFNVDEPREHWRESLYEVASELVADCQSPGEAAQRLNERLFGELNVRYSTQRKRANQCPSESIEQGIASCTGLSVLLVDACRSVCVPARLAGIPSWPNKRGNHTWVEVWDGQWHFTGAAEPSGEGLNHAWFTGDAALAVKDSRMNAIYAISFKETETEFPLVWNNQSGAKVYAVNVTDRYTGGNEPEQAEDMVQTRIRVWNHNRTERVEAEVIVARAYEPDTEMEGQTTGNEADMNNLLSFDLQPETHYRIVINHDGTELVIPARTGTEPTQLIEINLPKPHGAELSEEQKELLKNFVDRRFAAADDGEVDVEVGDELDALLHSHPERVREFVWEAYLESPAAMNRKDDFENDQVTFEQHVSPYTVKEVGERPEGGWPLVIAMHGGGGAPQRVNDSQWDHMKIYYKDHPEVGGYKYLALRAPNNTWNGFYDVYVYPLIENLIRQMVVHGDVNPNHVMLIGYSHGGYGAFAIGPKIPYRFSAIHSSAAAPTGGETCAATLRNTRFTFMVGENDNAYGRRERCQNYAAEIDQLQQGVTDCSEYPVEFLYQPGYGHGGLPDRDILPNLYPYQRDTAPLRVTWQQTDTVVKQFFWLADSNPQKGKTIVAEISGNQVSVTVTVSGETTVEEASESISVFVDHRLIDPEQPVDLIFNDQQMEAVSEPSIDRLCDMLDDNGDISLSFDRELTGN